MTLPRAFECVRAGRPGRLLVVATDCPSDLRLIRTDGRFGRLAPMEDASAMTEAISARLDAPFDRRLTHASGSDFTLAKSTALYLHAHFPDDQSS
jgi:hypothetical protein